MTDTGAVVLGMSMALPLLKAVDAKPGSSNLGKCLMLGVAFAGVLGGFALPCGHSLNILGMGVMETTIGETVSFLGWMLVGLPIFAFMLPVTWWLLTRVFPPESLADKRDVIEAGAASCGASTPKDKKSLAILVFAARAVDRGELDRRTEHYHRGHAGRGVAVLARHGP